MCGISGLLGDSRPGLMDAMNRAQAHRGPDGRGVFEDAAAAVALGHVRLAILDLSAAAAQPMQTADGDHVLTFNGEIYNFRDLRPALEKRGARFRSTGDAEVLLYGLALEGERFLDRLNGIFAFAWWDRKNRALLLARDAAGVKPVYYTCPRPDAVLFASEIKALFAYPGLARQPNFEALQEHLARCHASGVHTALAGVFRLPPGHTLRWSAEAPSPKIKAYWRPSFDAGRLGGYAKGVQELKRSLQAASARQLISDVPLGIFLSGGLDSSLVARCAVEGRQVPTDAYTISYPASENVLDQFDDDRPYAIDVARSLKLDHHLIEITPKVADLLPKLIWHLDEPIADPAVIAAFLVSRLARENGTVVLLSGQGGDELFGGYPRYQAMAATRWAAALPVWIRRAVARAAGLIPGTREGRVGAAFRRFGRVAGAIAFDSDERFMAYCSSSGDVEIDRIMNPEVVAILGGRPSARDSLGLMGESGLPYGDRFLFRDLTDYLPNHNLLYTDKMGMAVGVEARVPLLDQELLDTVPGMPYDWKVTRLTTKRILRDAARGWVADSILKRPKAGFGAPYRKWLRYDLAELWGDVMNERSVRRRGWFDPVALVAVRDRSQRGQSDLYMLQWAVLTCELWAREFLDKNPLDVAVAA
jgi:asparagine synthase (glutamine-hydrolysing)